MGKAAVARAVPTQAGSQGERMQCCKQKKRKVCAARQHNGGSCTQKQRGGVLKRQLRIAGVGKGGSAHTYLASAMLLAAGGMHCDQLLFVQPGMLGLRGHDMPRPVV